MRRRRQAGRVRVSVTALGADAGCRGQGPGGRATATATGKAPCRGPAQAGSPRVSYSIRAFRRRPNLLRRGPGASTRPRPGAVSGPGLRFGCNWCLTATGSWCHTRHISYLFCCKLTTTRSATAGCGHGGSGETRNVTFECEELSNAAKSGCGSAPSRVRQFLVFTRGADFKSPAHRSRARLGCAQLCIKRRDATAAIATGAWDLLKRSRHRGTAKRQRMDRAVATRKPGQASRPLAWKPIPLLAVS